VRTSDFIVQARASACMDRGSFLCMSFLTSSRCCTRNSGSRFRVFILSEANLGILGLGVAEPLPSWGSLLRELEGLMSFREEPWRLVPLVLLIIVMTSFQMVLSKEEVVA